MKNFLYVFVFLMINFNLVFNQESQVDSNNTQKVEQQENSNNETQKVEQQDNSNKETEKVEQQYNLNNGTEVEQQETPELLVEEFNDFQEWEMGYPIEEEFEIQNNEVYNMNDFNNINNFDSNDYQNIANYVKKQYEDYEQNIEIQAQNNNEYEDKVAKNWIFIFSFSLLVCIALFLYNIFKCYKKTIVQKPEDTRTYSKELQNANGTDDDDINININ